MEENNDYPGPGSPERPVLINEMPKSEDRYAVISLVLGIISIVGCIACGAGAIVGVIGLIFGIISLVKKKPKAGIAIAGVVTSIFGIVFGAVAFFISLISIAL